MLGAELHNKSWELYADTVPMIPTINRNVYGIYKIIEGEDKGNTVGEIEWYILTGVATSRG